MREDLLRYMQQMAALRRSHAPASLPYSCLEDFLLAEGLPYAPIPSKPKVRRGVPKQCFSNATTYALQHPESLYCEGLVLLSSLPIAIHHAWVVNPEGYAIDVTLAWETDAAFYGITFETDDLMRRLMKQKFYGLFDNGVGYTDLLCGTDPTFNYRRPHARKAG